MAVLAFSRLLFDLLPSRDELVHSSQNDVHRVLTAGFMQLGVAAIYSDLRCFKIPQMGDDIFYEYQHVSQSALLKPKPVEPTHALLHLRYAAPT
jgi:hypothetical protein